MLDKIKDKTNIFISLIVLLFIIILVHEKATAIDKESHLDRSGIEITKPK